MKIKDKPMITHERLKELVEYDPETGIITWKISHRSVTKGQMAGTIISSGYVRISLDNRFYQRSHLAWFYVKKVWPTKFLDHINGIPTDDRIVNLREATCMQNGCNRTKQKNNTTGFKGVSQVYGGKYGARIRSNKRIFWLGTFDDPIDAHNAYCEAAKKLHGEYAKF